MEALAEQGEQVAMAGKVALAAMAATGAIINPWIVVLHIQAEQEPPEETVEQEEQEEQEVKAAMAGKELIKLLKKSADSWTLIKVLTKLLAAMGEPYMFKAGE